MKTLQRFLIEGQTKKVKMKLSKFINLYYGERLNKITEDILYDELCWDYLADDFDMSLQEVADILNANLKNEFEFTQEDIGNCISIDWDIDDKHFTVDSTDWIE